MIVLNRQAEYNLYFVDYALDLVGKLQLLIIEDLELWLYH